MKLVKEQPSSHELFYEEFLVILESLNSQIERFGFKTRLTSPSARERFFSLPSEEMAHLLEKVKADAIRLERISDSYYDEMKELETFLTDMGFAYSTDAINQLKSSHVIEVYDSSFKAIYRSPSYYDLISYSTADLYLFQWNELYAREEEIDFLITDRVLDAFEKKAGQIIPLSINTHQIWERFSEEMRYCSIEPVFFSPVELKSGAKGLITVNKVENIVSRLSE